MKPPTFSAFILSLSHATEAPGEHWRKPDACFGHLCRLHAENRHPDATAMLKDLIYVQETEYCPEDQCDFAIQEDYRLYDNSTAGTLIIGMLYVSPVFVCIALAILSFKTLSTLDHERRCFAVLYSLRADAKMQRASLLRQTGAFFLTSFLLPLLFNAYFTGRGLSKDLLSMYFNMGLVYAGRRQSCLFVCFDKDAVPRYAMLRSTDPSSHVFAGG